ncbi:MAG: DUF4158 domain-containing protein [Clostridia bacterium]|nr:DUF4158 domain-containing protein [Clostridia bacterium]
MSNKTGATRLGFAVLFKFFQHEARFPNYKQEIPKDIIHYIAKQLSFEAGLFQDYNWKGRSIKYHRSQIRKYFNFKEATIDDMEKMSSWLQQQVLYHDAEFEHLKGEAYNHFRELQLEPPTPDQIDRLVKSVLYSYEKQFFQETFQKIPHESLSQIDLLINDLTRYEESNFDGYNNDGLSFSQLRADPGRIGLESVLKEIAKLKTIQKLNLPRKLFKGIPQKVIKKYKQRAVTEDIRELRRHPEPIRYTLLAAFLYLRGQEITDNLIELLIQIIHRIGVRAERKVDKQFIKDFKNTGVAY